VRRDQCRRRGIEAQQRAAEATDTKIVKRIRRAGALVGGWHVRGLPAYSLGYVDFAIFIAMMPTILIAAPLGVRAGHWLSETWLRRVYTVLLFVIAADLIRKLVS
jgi:uncharacterized protein